MTGRTERQYRRRAHYPARINLGITNELRAALKTLADKADTCVAEVARDCIEGRARRESSFGCSCCVGAGGALAGRQQAVEGGTGEIGDRAGLRRRARLGVRLLPRKLVLD